jgi:hypothetical protein
LKEKTFYLDATKFKKIYFQNDNIKKFSIGHFQWFNPAKPEKNPYIMRGGRKIPAKAYQRPQYEEEEPEYEEGDEPEFDEEAEEGEEEEGGEEEYDTEEQKKQNIRMDAPDRQSLKGISNRVQKFVKKATGDAPAPARSRLGPEVKTKIIHASISGSLKDFSKDGMQKIDLGSQFKGVDGPKLVQSVSITQFDSDFPVDIAMKIDNMKASNQIFSSLDSEVSFQAVFRKAERFRSNKPSHDIVLHSFDVSSLQNKDGQLMNLSEEELAKGVEKKNYEKKDGHFVVLPTDHAIVRQYLKFHQMEAGDSDEHLHYVDALNTYKMQSDAYDTMYEGMKKLVAKSPSVDLKKFSLSLCRANTKNPTNWTEVNGELKNFAENKQELEYMQTKTHNLSFQIKVCYI